MQRKTKQYVIWIIISVISILIIISLISYTSKPGELDEFAKCLEEKEAIFYGAFWCPICQNQKKMFGRSKKYLPYIECSTPDGKNQIFQCSSKNIERYPTWEFADGSRESGELSLERLAEKTGCILPAAYNP